MSNRRDRKRGPPEQLADHPEKEFPIPAPLKYNILVAWSAFDNHFIEGFNRLPNLIDTGDRLKKKIKNILDYINLEVIHTHSKISWLPGLPPSELSDDECLEQQQIIEKIIDKKLKQPLKDMEECIIHADASQKESDILKFANLIFNFLRKYIIFIQHCVFDKQLRFSKLPEGIDENELKDIVNKLVELKLIDYPWKKVELSEEKVIQMFYKLKDRQWEEKDIDRTTIERIPGVQIGKRFPLTFDGNRSLTLISRLSDYKKIDIISDYFQEEQRLSGKRKGKRVPLEVWKEEAGAEATEVFVDKKQITPWLLREKLFLSFGKLECTQFKSSLTRRVIDLFRAKYVLDISAGWGDRLIGAIAAQSCEKYYATDPNTALKRGHDQIKEMLLKLTEKKSENFIIDYVPFETADLKDMKFDLVFTSPPYFDLEVYSNLPTQSINTHNGQKAWITNFLFESLKRAWKALLPNGHMVIHITDTGGNKCCEPMNCFVVGWLPGAVYKGMIASLAGASIPRPMWVWQKKENCSDFELMEKQDIRKFAKNNHYDIFKDYPYDRDLS